MATGLHFKRSLRRAGVLAWVAQQLRNATLAIAPYAATLRQRFSCEGGRQRDV
jgi:hypothetical protein